MTTTGSQQQPKSSHVLLLQHREKIMMMGGCLREERRHGGKWGRKVRDGNRALCTVFPYPIPISFPTQLHHWGFFSSLGTETHNLLRRQQAVGTDPILPHSLPSLLCSCCTSERRSIDRYCLHLRSKDRGTCGKVAGAERPAGPITTAPQGLWLVAEKQPRHHAAASGLC